MKGLHFRRMGAGSSHSLAFAFNDTDQDDYDYLKIWHTDTKQAPHGFEVIDGAVDSAVTETSTDANMPTLISTDVLCVRVTNNVTTVSVKCATSEGGLGSASDCYSSTDFDNAGGMLGFSPNGDKVAIDDVKFMADRDSNGTYETTEHEDDFTLDSSGYAEASPIYDLAGNLTYDGVFSYTFDAWGRLVKVTKAYPDGPDVGSDPDLGSVIAEIKYDSLGNRIIKQVKNSANLDFTYHYYYDEDSIVEVRNGSDDVIKQYVWGVLYIDELIQVGLNNDPTDGLEDDVESFYYILDENDYSVAGLADNQGALVERYGYGVYGQRVTYFAPGNNDSGLHAPTGTSRRWQVSSVNQPYGLNVIGHQGLLHDEETGLVNNRLRTLSPRLARFSARDPLEYIGGMNQYQYLGSNPIGWLDPFGLDRLVFDGKKLCRITDDGSKCIKCWKPRSGKRLRDNNAKVITVNGMPQFPKPTVKEQKQKGIGPIPEGEWTLHSKRLKKPSKDGGIWKRTDRTITRISAGILQDPG